MSDLTIHMFPCLADNYGYLLARRGVGCDGRRRHAGRGRDRGTARRQGLAADPHSEHAPPCGSRGRQSRAEAANGLHDRRPARRCRAHSGHRRGRGRGRRRRARERIAPRCSTRRATRAATSSTHFAASRAAFVGDTLFALGCGRLFEGTPGADVELAAEDPAVARRHANLLRARVHAEQRALRADRRAAESRAARSARRASRSCAPRDERRCRARSARNARRIRSCGRKAATCARRSS